MKICLVVDEEGAALVRSALENESLFWKSVRAPHAREKRRVLARLLDEVERQVEDPEKE